MLTERLPVHVDPFRFAETGRAVRGRVPLAEMGRLLPSLDGVEGEAEVELEFGIDRQGFRFVRGRVGAVLRLLCQRCLQPMGYPVGSEFLLGIVADEAEAESLPDSYEPLVTGHEPLYLRDVIEDELILALPTVPRHPLPECSAAAQLGQDEEAPQGENPFAVLSRLKPDGNKNA